MSPPLSMVALKLLKLKNCQREKRENSHAQATRVMRIVKMERKVGQAFCSSFRLSNLWSINIAEIFLKKVISQSLELIRTKVIFRPAKRAVNSKREKFLQL
jgi:hypothetical protein